MVSCPVCGESRWIYPRQHALGWVVRPLTGWQASRCKACGWRGWRRSLPEAGGRAPVRLVAEYLTAIAGRLPTLQVRAPSRAATWLIVSVAVGVAIAGVQFSARKRSRTPDVVLPVEVHRPPELPPVVQAIERSHPDFRPSPVAASLPDATLSVPDPPRAREQRPPRRPAAVAPTMTTIAAEPFRGSLVITSEPLGALVKVDGEVVGPTPVVLNDVRAGSRVVRIESSGYDTWSTAARVVANRETRVNATLRREPRP